MGLLRKVAQKVVGRLSGSPRAESPLPVRPAAPTRPPPPAPPSAQPGPGADLFAAERFATMECGAQELKERLDAGEIVVIVDVRESAELSSGILPGARHLPLSSLQERWTELKDADEIVCYCAVGARSLHAATFLRGQGLINATSLEGGIQAWREVGGATPRPA